MIQPYGIMMLRSVVIWFFIFCLVIASDPAQALKKKEIDPSFTLLPNNLKIYPVPGGGVSTVQKDSTTIELTLPTTNKWLADPGCYLTCHTKDETLGVFPTGNGAYVVGQIRVPGHYDQDGMCKTPLGKDEDMSTSRRFKYMCNVAFKESCKYESCWAEPKTSHFFEGR